MAKTNGKRNRSQGNGWERTLAKMFREAGYPDVITTRQGSRELDAMKIDLMNSNASEEGRLPFNCQAKNVRGHLPYAKVLGELPNNKGIINVVCHKMTAKVNDRFVETGTYAIVNLVDFFKMVKRLKELEQENIKLNNALAGMEETDFDGNS